MGALFHTLRLWGSDTPSSSGSMQSPLGTRCTAGAPEEQMASPVPGQWGLRQRVPTRGGEAGACWLPCPGYSPRSFWHPQFPRDTGTLVVPGKPLPPTRPRAQASVAPGWSLRPKSFQGLDPEKWLCPAVGHCSACRHPGSLSQPGAPGSCGGCAQPVGKLRELSGCDVGQRDGCFESLRLDSGLGIPVGAVGAGGPTPLHPSPAGTSGASCSRPWNPQTVEAPGVL